MKQSINTHFGLSANHADKQVTLGLHVLAKHSGNTQITDVSDVTTAIILIEFLIRQKKLIKQFFIDKSIN